jgi:hypothetical protein
MKTIGHSELNGVDGGGWIADKTREFLCWLNSDESWWVGYVGM